MDSRRKYQIKLEQIKTCLIIIFLEQLYVFLNIYISIYIYIYLIVRNCFLFSILKTIKYDVFIIHLLDVFIIIFTCFLNDYFRK